MNSQHENYFFALIFIPISLSGHKFAYVTTAAAMTYANWWFIWPGPRFNIKMSSYRYRKSHCGDKTVVRSSYLHNGISYTSKMSSLYWIGAQYSYDYELPKCLWNGRLPFTRWSLWRGRDLERREVMGSLHTAHIISVAYRYRKSISIIELFVSIYIDIYRVLSN